jgi:hypothetical protein
LKRSVCAAAAFIALLPSLALAQVGPDSVEVEREDLQIFEPAFFDRFSPQTARDMLNQVPGFTIRQTGGGRGLGQGGANVLIDGERVTSKDTNALEILNRTPVDAVVRIEVADAAALGVTGLTGQVANVVLDRSRLSGSFEYAPNFRKGARPKFTDGSISVSGSSGALDYTLGFENDSHRGYEAGEEIVIDDQFRVLETRDETVSLRIERPSVTMALGYEVGPRTSLSVNGSATSYSFEGRERSFRDIGETREALNSEDEWNADIAGELRYDVGAGTLRSIAYQRFEHSPTLNRTIASDSGGITDFATFEQTVDEGETIGRVEYAWTRENGVSWEVSGETAYNFLDREAVLTEAQGADEEITVFPDLTVDELRNQASLTRSFELFEDFAVQAAVSGEWSRLTVSGDGSNREQTFLRPRGFVSIAYPLTDNVSLRSRVAREVGQLNFFDFISSVNLTEERQSAGNTDLIPQQSWDGEIELQTTFGKDEKIIARLEGYLIEDRVDRVLIPVTEDGEAVLRDAVGNIDEARLAVFALEGTVLTERWGFEGGRFDINSRYRTSSLEDPLTGETRNFSGLQPWFYEVRFRHDVPNTNWAWGGRVFNQSTVRFIRFDEVFNEERGGPFLRVFLEDKDFFGNNLRFGYRNLTNLEYTLDRTRFANFRDGPVGLAEQRLRTENRTFEITLSGTF